MPQTGELKSSMGTPLRCLATNHELCLSRKQLLLGPRIADRQHHSLPGNIFTRHASEHIVHSEVFSC